MTRGFRLFESLRWEPSGGYFLLDPHLQRLQRSAAHFGFAWNPDVARERLLGYAETLPGQPRKVRLDLAADGAVTLQDEEVKPSTPIVVALSREPVPSGDEFLRHKTTRRAVFERALATHPQAQDVLLWNERRELTETCHGNLVLEIGGRRLTPPVGSGLLPGTFRAHLLERHELEEEVLPVDALAVASAVFMVNSVRKWCGLRLIAS